MNNKTPQHVAPLISPTSLLWITGSMLTLLAFFTVAALLVRPEDQLGRLSQVEDTQAAAPAGSRVRYLGQDWWLLGANLPLLTWGCDFGSGCSPESQYDPLNTVRNPKKQAELRPWFQKMKDSNITVLRWWLSFNGGGTNPSGNTFIITEDRGGKKWPVSLHPGVFEDIDAAVRLAREYDLYYNFTIFNSPRDYFGFPVEWNEDPAYRAQLVNVLGTMFERYKNEPRIMFWELWNEPEQGLGSPEESNTFAVGVRQLTRDTVAKLRSYNPINLFNLGIPVDHIPFWSGINPDIITPHYYTNYDGSNPNRDMLSPNLTADIIRQKYGITTPIIPGEIYLGSETPVTDYGKQFEPLRPGNAAERLNILHRGNYAGAWAWSLHHMVTADQLPFDLAVAKEFARTHPEVGPRAVPITSGPTPTIGGGITPSPTPTVRPTSITPTPIGASPTPTRMPTPTTAGPTPIQEFTLSVSGAKSNYQSSETLQVTLSVQSRVSGNYLVDFEIYNATGQKVMQQYWDNQAFTQGQTRQYTITVPMNTYENGQYKLTAGIFGPNWQPLKQFDHNLFPFTIGPATGNKRGDVNQDGSVNVFDLGIMMGYYGQRTSTNPSDTSLQASDLNNNGTVDIFDLGILAANYGQ